MGSPLLVALLALVLLPLVVIAMVYLLIPVLKGIGWLVTQVFRFVIGEIADVLRFVGAVVTMLVLVPLVLGSIVIGRWSATGHFGRAVQGELMTAGRCVYRVLIGHPARLLCLTPLTEGIERRIPEVVAGAPGRDTPSRRVGQFEGYKIVGSLPGGGSGGKLYIAEASTQKLASFARNGQPGVDRVVIKAFSLDDGSSLPQIVRESRALDAAKRMGLILEHELTDERFHYVMRYVPGDGLGMVTQRLHAMSGGDGLGSRELREALGYGLDLLRTLQVYHRGGLWHKDVKPDNIIVSGGRAHLVDFGLVTPLGSSMTLTTHGTEYFRDPEMVRMALKGMKVAEVDGAKFDVYAVGAVLYSMIENSFPAHGGLSQVTRRCPEALRWVIRRAMTEYDKRYASAGAMLDDLAVIAGAEDPFAVKPIALPSMGGAGSAGMAGARGDEAQQAGWQAAGGGFAGAAAGAGAAVAGTPGEPAQGAGEYAFDFELNEARGGGVGNAAAAAAAAAGSGERVGRGAIRVSDWWTGRFEFDRVGGGARGAGVVSPPPLHQVNRAGPGVYAGTPRARDWAGAEGARVEAVAAGMFGTPYPGTPRGRGWSGMPAKEQLERARARAKEARGRAHARIRRRAGGGGSAVNAGVVVALLLFVGALGVLALFVMTPAVLKSRARVVTVVPPVQVDMGKGWGVSDGEADIVEQVGISSAGLRDEAAAFELASGVEVEGGELRVGPEGLFFVGADGERASFERWLGSAYGVNKKDVEALAHAMAARGRVLIVRDAIAFEAANRDEVNGALERLNAAGFRLVGDVDESLRDELGSEEDVSLRSEFEYQTRLRQVGIEELGKNVRNWLEARPEFEAVVWWGRGDEGTMTAWVMPRGEGKGLMGRLVRTLVAGDEPGR